MRSGIQRTTLAVITLTFWLVHVQAQVQQMAKPAQQEVTTCKWFDNFTICGYVQAMSNRRFEDFVNQSNWQSGNLLRLQAQINF